MDSSNDEPGANPPPPREPEPSDDEFEAERDHRNYRRARRRARERAGEIKELNITAMMDMMTILLVFLLKSYTASSSTVQMTDELQIPNSTTKNDPRDRINITVSSDQVAVNDRKVASVINGSIPDAERQGGTAQSMLITSLLAALTKEVEKEKYIAQYNPASPFSGQVNVIADKRIPYRTILAVLYTAGQAELSQYQLMALRNE